MGSPRSPASRLLAASTAMVLLVAYVALPMCGRITAGDREFLAHFLPLLTSYRGLPMGGNLHPAPPTATPGLHQP